MKQRATRLLDKFHQVVVGKSGTPRDAHVKCVWLRVDGTLTGRVASGVLAGSKVRSDSLSTRVWEVCV